jgi:restriction endonuclease S subunit
VNQHVCVIRSDGSLDAEFLAFYLATPDFQKFVFDSQAGATRQALTKGMIEEFQIPFAELAEQKRIAGILKEQMAAVERARRSAEAQLQAAEAPPAAYLRAVFNSTEAEGWLPTRLSEVAFFQEGPGVRTHQFRNSGVKLLNVTNLVGGSLQLNNTNKYLEESEAYGRYKHFLVDENDIILASSGASWGKVAIARKQDLPLVMNTSTIRLRPSDERKLDRAFLQFFLESESFKEQIRLLITGAAQPNFGPMHLKQVEIRLPSAADQRRLAAQLSSQMASAERLHQTLAEQLDAIHRLPAALLREAFSGRL